MPVISTTAIWECVAHRAVKRQHRPMPSSRRRASPRAGSGRLAADVGDFRGYQARIERRISGALRGHHALRSEHSHTPEGPPATSPDATARAVSVDKYTFHEAYSRHLRQAEEWPQTKFFLQREIEARSQRISANWHQWQQRAEATAVVGSDKAFSRSFGKGKGIRFSLEFEACPEGLGSSWP
eukprot:s1471_g4.t1